MSPQTVRTISRDDRTARSVTRVRARVSTVLRHEMTVVASSVADVVTSAGGWLFDRRMAGWQVNVLLSDRVGARALQILGADALDLSGDLEAITDDPDRAATLAVATDVYAADERVRRFVTMSDRNGADVALFGDASELGNSMSAVQYHMSTAATAFKVHALLAVGTRSDSVAATEALFRRGVTALAPVAANLR